MCTSEQVFIDYSKTKRLVQGIRNSEFVYIGFSRVKMYHHVGLSRSNSDVFPTLTATDLQLGGQPLQHLKKLPMAVWSQITVLWPQNVLVPWVEAVHYPEPKKQIVHIPTSIIISADATHILAVLWQLLSYLYLHLFLSRPLGKHLYGLDFKHYLI